MGEVVVSDEVRALGAFAGAGPTEHEENGHFFGGEGRCWFWGRWELWGWRCHVCCDGLEC